MSKIIIKKTFLNRLFITILTATVFIAFILIIYFIRYNELPDMRFINEIVLIITAIGVIPILFGKFSLGITFLSSSIIGFIGDAVITLLRQNRPNMTGGFFFTACLIVGFIVGILLEIIIPMERKVVLVEDYNQVPLP